MRWALEYCLGVVQEDPEPEPYDAGRAREIVGAYENDAMTFTITTDGASLSLEVLIRPEIRATSEVELPADYPPFPPAARTPRRNPAMSGSPWRIG